MALTDLQKMLVYGTATSMWQQDLLFNAYFQGSSVGANLRNMLLGQTPILPLTNPSDQAITGRLRSDSAALRQNAANVSEAASMAGLAASTLDTIVSTLEEMEDLALQIKTGELDYSSTVETEYNELRDKISGLIEGTLYNGMAMLDSSQWGTSQIDSDGNVYIQSMLNGGFNLTFHALDDVSWSDLDGSNLENLVAGDLQGQLDTLSGYISDMETIADIYSGREDNLTGQATAMQSQADLLDQVVASQTQSPASSLESLLLRLLSQTSGSLLDEQG